MATDDVGSVVALWRYPVKSMMGEELNVVAMTERGLLGDRVYALLDLESGKVASAKNPRKWSRLFDFRAAFTEAPNAPDAIPPVRITLPDGRVTDSGQTDCDATLAAALGREVTLARTAPPTPTLEEYWPELEGLAHQDTVTDETLPPGTFFDLGVVHVLTTATIDRLRALYPQGRFEVRRFRPNIVIAPPVGEQGFVENGWIDAKLRIGDEVVLQVTGPCPRCVMTTLAQGDLPSDPGILRTAAQHNDVNVGIYAAVVQQGSIRRGDSVQLT